MPQFLPPRPWQVPQAPQAPLQSAGQSLVASSESPKHASVAGEVGHCAARFVSADRSHSQRWASAAASATDGDGGARHTWTPSGSGSWVTVVERVFVQPAEQAV